MEWIAKIIEFLKAEWLQAVLVSIYMLVEYFLGKSTLVKPGSVLEVILSGIKKVLELLKIKKPE